MVRRLKAAGAVIVGKTNTCELGQWPFTSGPGFGHTRNPWSRRHTPGGSSGGSAAAVAAGLVTAAIGSDGAGSVRIPAAWTHLVGIKPQRGRISTWPLPEAFNGITVNGVLARTVADAALVLDAASGQRRGRPAQAAADDGIRLRRQRARSAEHRAVNPVPVHLLSGQVAPRNPGRDASRGQAARAARPQRGHGQPGLRPAVVVGLSGPVHRGPAGLGGAAGRRRHPGPPHRVQPARRATVLGQAILRSARRHEAADQHRVGSIFDIVDVVLAPTTAQPPPLARSFDRLGGLGTDRAMIRACPVTWPWNVLGWPSINVPAGFTSDGLPIGVQLMGPANSEGMLISLAAELEAVCGWATKQPKVWWDREHSARLTIKRAKTQVGQAVWGHSASSWRP